MRVEIDADRFRTTFEEFSTVGATENGGLHRLALTDADKRARDHLLEILREWGFRVAVDEVGNIFGERPGTDPDARPVLIGSHLDTQPFAGRFDGQLGVLTALETLLAFEEQNIETDRPVRLVNWTAEEGSRFGRPILGSLAYVGGASTAEILALADEAGRTVGAELARIGYDGDTACEAGDVHAYLELHIEQGPILERSDAQVGVVEGIWGSCAYDVVVTGQPDHAGTTLLPDRQDALRSAAMAIEEITSVPRHLSDDVVVTVGEIETHPGSSNVVPGRCRFSIDNRAETERALEMARERFERALRTSCNRNETRFELEKRFRSDVVEFAPSVIDSIQTAAESLGVTHRRVMNGAGHDAKALASIADSGMVFVPSENGVSHNEDEYTPWEDAVAGARVFANAVHELATV